MYNDEEAFKRLREAIDVMEKCDPAECDCEECPIGKPMELLAHDAGVKLVASTCSFISMLKDICEEPKEFVYKPD